MMVVVVIIAQVFIRVVSMIFCNCWKSNVAEVLNPKP